MHTILDYELDILKEKIFKMLDMSLESINNSMDALKKFDINLAQKVIDNDKKVDKLENIIDEECLRILVTKQPAATDARLILSILKINTDLEKIADLSTSIAIEVKNLVKVKILNPLINLFKMSEISCNMLKDALDSISNKNSVLAKEIILKDDILDEINNNFHGEMYSYISKKPEFLNQAISLMKISKSLERIGDHIANIAERAVYYIDGDNVRHTESEKVI